MFSLFNNVLLDGLFISKGDSDVTAVHLTNRNADIDGFDHIVSLEF
jgi:hypothetical protein